MQVAYLNGNYLPLAQAQISALDRGFLFGDSIYEVIPVYRGKIFLLEEHLTRLNRNLSAIKLNVPTCDWQAILTTLVQHNEGKNHSIYLQITRGVGPTRAHAMPQNTPPTIFAFCLPPIHVSIATLEKGATAITMPDLRWKRCDIKTNSLLANILLNQQALDAQANDAILINDGYAIEAAASNLFIVKNNTLITTPCGPSILGGITRDLIIRLATRHNITTAERRILESELFTADEVWLSSSTQAIRPVLKINQHTIADGKPGPMWHRVLQIYLDYIDHYAH